MLRNRTSRLGVAIGAALLSFSLAAPALAERGDGWRGDRDRRGYTVHRHGDHCDHDRDGRWRRDWDRDGRRDWDRDWDRGDRHWHRDRDWDRRGHRWHDGRAYYGRDDRHAYEYGCRRHGKRWRDQERFHRHLISDHHVPYYAIPQAVVFAGWGWDFRD